jgi:formylglycine-generating enzyme required for sulfatase activity
MTNIRISSKFYKNKTAQITFYSSSAPNIPVNLGSYTIPYTRTGTDVYGRYEVYFPIYSKTCSVSLKDPGLLPGANTANWQNCADWDGLDGNLTTVGTNGGPSAYGTYDMCGNVAEIIDRIGGSSKIYRGRSYSDSSNFSSQYNSVPNATPENEFVNVGFRVASLSNYFNFDNFVGVGDVNNSNDPLTGFGSVTYTYYIGKYEVTNSEYAEFLNAVADADTFGLYNTNMGGSRGGITRNGTYGKYSYSVKDNYGNKPVNWVSWFDCARYCNWLHNNKNTVGIEDYDTTEDGAYTLNGAIAGYIARNSNAKYSIPTENEWYKAAYYKGGTGSTNAGYWLYATQSDTPPTCVSANTNGDGPGSTTSTTTTTTTTTTPSPSTVWAAVSTGSSWDNAGFIGAGTFANPFRVTKISDNPTSRGVNSTGYINITFDSFTLSDCSNDNFEIAINGNSVANYNCGQSQTSILSLAITAGQTLDFRPDSSAIFRNLRIWWSAPVTTTTTTTPAPTTTTTTTTLPPTPKLNISRLVAGANTSTITSSFSGNGTSPTPYVRSTSYFSDVDNQLWYYRFTATSSGTFYWKATVDDDGNGDDFYVKKTSGGVVTTITYSGTDSRSIGGSSGKDGTYGSMSMINGDIFEFVASNPGSASFSSVSIYAT